MATEQKYEVKTDCFAYCETCFAHNGTKVRKVDCSALRELYCKKGKCNFYKPKECCMEVTGMTSNKR